MKLRADSFNNEQTQQTFNQTHQKTEDSNKTRNQEEILPLIPQKY